MKKLSVYSICILWMMIDQIIKRVIITTLNVGEKILILPSFFQIHYLQNDGAAFSSFSGMRILLVIVTVFSFFLLANFIKRNEINSRLEIISLGMILGGLMGNLIDRLIYGYVVDYLSFKILNYSFAVFNFADIGIVIGTILFFILVIRSEKNGKKES